MSYLSKLFDVASPSIGPDITTISAGPLVCELVEHILSKKNGFLAYENALLVRPLGAQESLLGLSEWNASELWRSDFGQDLSGHIFFAENIFGEQFSISEYGVFLFDPELGELKKFAQNLDSWAKEILEDFDYITGHSLAHEWQSKFGVLSFGQRLLPRQPFVLQGAFATENLIVKADVEGMKIRAQLADQIAKLPDGATLTFEVTE